MNHAARSKPSFRLFVKSYDTTHAVACVVQGLVFRIKDPNGNSRWGTLSQIYPLLELRLLNLTVPMTFQTPSARVNNLSRSLYRQVRDALNNKRLRSNEILGDRLGTALLIRPLSALHKGIANRIDAAIPFRNA